jgi:glycosyltransferase involved in cell wall biosynthesis
MELACERLVRDLLAGGHKVRWLAQTDGLLPDFPPEVCVPLAGTDIIYRMSGVPAPVVYPWAIGPIARAVWNADLVIIVEANFLVSVMAFVAARLMRRKVILVQHVGEPSTLSRLARLVMQGGEALFTRRIVRKADAVVFVSRSVAIHFQGIRSKGLAQIIGHAIDVHRFNAAQSDATKQTDREELGLPQQQKVACFVGRITESKGIYVIHHLAQQRPDWMFAIAGKGPVDPRDWGLPNVIVLGQLDQTRVAQLYRCSDAMTLPSQSESFSLVVREAMACGCRVICAEQILQTDPQLDKFISAVPVDLANAEQTAQIFGAALDSPAKADPSLARDFVVRECSPHEVRKQYLTLVAKTLNLPGAAPA